MAVDNRPNYDEAMQYLNLIYRNKADVDYGNTAAVTEDLAMAEEWTDEGHGYPQGQRREEERRAPAASPWIQAARCTSRDVLCSKTPNGLCSARRPFFFGRILLISEVYFDQA